MPATRLAAATEFLHVGQFATCAIPLGTAVWSGLDTADRTEREERSAATILPALARGDVPGGGWRGIRRVVPLRASVRLLLAAASHRGGRRLYHGRSAGVGAR